MNPDNIVSLKLSNQAIGRLPQDMPYCEDKQAVEVMVATNSQVHTLTSFASFHHLVMLDLAGNNLKRFVAKSKLQGLAHLTQLNLSQNQISNINSPFFQDTPSLKVAHPS